MPQLDSPRHEAFARSVASGMNGSAAYRKVYGKGVKGARQSASDLLTNPDIRQRVDELVAASTTEAVYTLQQEKEWLTRVITTPISAIDEDNILCQRSKYTKDGRELWMVDKLGAMRLLADLKKELSDKPATNLNVNLNVRVMTEDRRRELMDRHKAALEAARQSGN